MGIPMIRGRKFTREDTTEVAIVNDASARKFWPNQNPIRYADPRLFGSTRNHFHS
jgi:hypothetical protein